MAPELQPREPDPPRVLVLGGGLAGIAAACHLVERGLRVTLVEKRPYLGGRAFSFTDPETGCQVDNGQHVFLGCCTQYIQLLQKLGTQEQAFLQPRFSMKVVDPQGRAELLASAFLPAPFHLLPALLRYPYLTWGERLRVVTTLGRIRFTDHRHPSLEGETFAHWLRRHGQSERAIRSFWNLIVLPALNDDIAQVSAAMGLMVFQEGVLKGRHSANIGYARVGLSALMGDAAQRYLGQQDAQLLLGKSVQQLLYQDERITGVTLADQQVLTADVFISALPFDLLRTVL
ncbi:MAG: FAD-dependent oxidoreductase, partial [Dehalococcoidia bacterium]